MWEKGYICWSYYKVWQFNFAGVFDIFRIKKCVKVILLQSVADCYYKVRQVLQSATVITKWDVTVVVPTLISWSKTKIFADYNDKI